MKDAPNHFFALTETLPAIVFVHQDGNLRYINPAAELILGYSRHELLEEVSLDAIYPGLGELARNHSTRARLRQLPAEFEVKVTSKSGAERWLDCSARIIEFDGKPAVLGFASDITDRKRTEETLRASEERFRQVTETIREVFWMTDPSKNQLIYISPGYETIWGRSCESLRASPWNWLEAIHPDDVARVKDALPRQASGEYNEVYRIVRPDGSVRWIEDRAFPVKDEAGKVYRVAGIAQDITEQKDAEERISLLADAVHSTREMISISDEENRFTFVNQAFMKRYGYSEKEILGRKPDFLYSRKNAPGLCERVFQESLAGGWTGEIINCKKDGTEFPISLQTSQIKNSRGEVIGLVGTARDISERKRGEWQSAAFSALGHLLSAASAPEQAASIILQTASELFGWDAGYVHLYSPAQDLIVPILTMDTIEGERKTVPETSFTLTPSRLMREVMQQGPQLIDRSEAPGTLELVPFGDTRRSSACMMYVPIQSAGTVLGILSIQSYTPRAYSRNDLKLLQALADSCGGALQRIRMTEALREAEAKYRGIFENATEGIFQTTAHGRYLHANPALARMFGYDSPAELISSVTNIEQQTFVSAEAARELKRLIETQDGALGFEAERFRKDGARCWTSINVRAMRDVHGSFLHYEGTVQDITASKKAEQRTLAFLRLGHCLSAAMGPEEAAGTILEIASDIFGWDAGYVHLYLPAEDKIIRVLTMDLVDGQRVRTPPVRATSDPNPMMRLVMDEGSQLINRDGKSSAPVELQPFGNIHRSAASMMYVPIRSSRTVVGVLSIQSYTHNAYSNEDLRVLQAFADACGDAFLRIRMTEALQEAEAKYRGIFEGVTEGIFRTTPEGRYLSANPALARMLGFDTPEQLLSSVTDIEGQTYVSPVRRKELKRLLESKGSVRDFEAERLRKDGSKFWITINAHTVRDENGTVLFYEGTTQDITKRKRAEEVLRENERKLRLIAENTTDVIFAFDMDRSPLYINPALEQLTGYTLEEVREKRFINWIHPEDQERMLRLWEELYAGKGYSNVEFRLVTKDGKIKWCSSTWGPLLDESGRQIGVQGVERDVTELRRAQSMMRELAGIVENSQDAIAGATLDGRITSWNKAAERIYGYSAEEVIGCRTAMLFPAGREHEAEELLRQISSGNKVETYETVRKKKDGSLIEVSVTVSPIKDAAGKVTGASAIARDITYRKQLEREVIETNANERRRIGHELHDGLGQYLAGTAFARKSWRISLARRLRPTQGKRKS